MVEVMVSGAIIVGLVEAIKRTGYLTSKWSAIVAIIIGVAYFLATGEADVTGNVIEGIISGLTAAGLYSGARATLFN